ncbi:hypothetical protein ACHAPJ_013010 [Fusarium lateritium]
MVSIEENEFEYEPGKTAFCLAAGSVSGPLIILCHGWPAIAKTWQHQLEAFSALGYRILAPDMPGYGRSAVPDAVGDYALERINDFMKSLLEHSERDRAIWIGHDWGAVAVWSFAAHYPEKTVAVAGLARPYHTLELGLEQVLGTVNRQIYPEKEYPYGQYDYQVYFEQSFDQVTKWMETDIPGVLRAVYARGRPEEVGKPSMTSTVTRDGGWLGGAPTPPRQLRAIPAQALCVDEAILDDMTTSMTKTGFRGANSWYLKHKRNRAYSLDKSANDGYLHMPVLFVGANWDPISDVAVSSIASAQKKYCTNLKEVNVDAGHWVALEKPDEVNALIAEWLTNSVPTV